MASNTNDKEIALVPDALPVPTREDLVKTAADFLKAPNVQGTAMHLKRAFLKKKGLSDSEIELAITTSEQLIHQQPVLVDRRGRGGVVGYEVVGRSHWSRLRDVANTLLIFGGLSYALYYLYKKYGAKYLFGGEGKEEGDKKKKITLEERLIEVEAGVGECVREVRGLKERRREELEAALAQTSPRLEEIRSEIASLKKLLLNRKQFAASPIVSGASVSIPSWQREEGCPSPQDKEEEGNGSNTNGSDSSLEMIKD